MSEFGSNDSAVAMWSGHLSPDHSNPGSLLFSLGDIFGLGSVHKCKPLTKIEVCVLFLFLHLQS